MEHASKVMVNMSVIDKRETGGNSVTMGKEGLRRLLEKLVNSLPFSELTTDASSSIIKLVGDMKGTPAFDIFSMKHSQQTTPTIHTQDF